MMADNNEKDKRFSKLLSSIENGKALPDKQFLAQLRERSAKEFETYSAESDNYSQTETISIWRIIMKSRITKIAAAAVIIIAVILSITFLDKTVAPVYAIEQTVKAIHNMRYVHLRYFDSSHENIAKECWIEIDDTGQPKNVRINWSKWMAGGEIVVWNKNRTKIWNSKRNFLKVFNDEIYTARVLKMANKENPRLSVERLRERESKGEVRIEIEEPSSKSEPIVVTATGIGENTKRFVLFVDQATKLVTCMKWYQLKKDGVYKYQGVMEYLDYNVPIDSQMFSLSNEIPADIQIIDTKTQDIGLAQGDIADEEIAIEVVRQFIESLIAKDYTKASQLFGGLSQDEIKKGWGTLNITRLVSIGEPVPSSKSSKIFPKTLSVPYTVEIEKNGERKIVERKQNINRVLGRRERWAIH